MPSSQQTANEALIHWQALRAEGLTPAERLEVLMRDFFSPPSPSDLQYEITLRDVAFEMAVA
jgi:hypothetical protein